MANPAISSRRQAATIAAITATGLPVSSEALFDFAVDTALVSPLVSSLPLDG